MIFLGPLPGAWWNLAFAIPFALGALLCALSLPILNRRAGARIPTRRGTFKASAGASHKRSSRQGVPPLLWAQSLLLWWGACGWGCNLLLGFDRPHPIAFAVAGLGAIVMSILAAQVLIRLAPPAPREVGGADVLAGLIGEASSAISADCGWAYVRDEHGVLHHARCFCEGEIGRGDRLVTLAWDEARSAYRVRAWTLGA